MISTMTTRKSKNYTNQQLNFQVRIHLFEIICQNLARLELNHSQSRVVLEKPLGHNLQSSEQINEFVAKFFSEEQIYRIDHYLGKESVQNCCIFLRPSLHKFGFKPVLFELPMPEVVCR
jgi:glucose-6-phosphate 1-dehydrogenase